MLIYGLLIPLTVINGLAMGYLSVKVSYSQDWFYFIGLALVNIMPIWAFISRYSKSIIFDELLFNTALMASYLAIVLIMGGGETFATINWIGLIIVFIGFTLLKIKTDPGKAVSSIETVKLT